MIVHINQFLLNFLNIAKHQILKIFKIAIILKKCIIFENASKTVFLLQKWASDQFSRIVPWNIGNFGIQIFDGPVDRVPINYPWVQFY